MGKKPKMKIRREAIDNSDGEGMISALLVLNPKDENQYFYIYEHEKDLSGTRDSPRDYFLVMLGNEKLSIFARLEHNGYNIECAGKGGRILKEKAHSWLFKVFRKYVELLVVETQRAIAVVN